jgi:energy-coupling factor transporter ATP-binding protein EcfA2
MTNIPGPVPIEVAGLRYHYPDGSPALHDVAFRATAGERIALLGPNGAGKSTLLLHLAGLLPERRRYLHTHDPKGPAHRHGLVGRVAIDGIEISPATIGRIRDRVGIVFQDPDDQLIGLTVGEDVAFGPRARRWSSDEVERAVAEALAAVHLTGFGDRSPHHLSAGEKRRVCLAGALACRPGLLLLDEPSSGLDPRGRRELAALLAGLPATTILASHALGFVSQLCPRVIVMDHGSIVADKDTGALLADRDFLLQHGLS